MALRRYFSSRRNWTVTIVPDLPPLLLTKASSPKKLKTIVEELKKGLHRNGLALVGITSPRKSARFDKYKEWLQKEYHGELDYMEREDRISRREDPSLILPGVKSVIMVGALYWPGATGFPDSHNFPAVEQKSSAIAESAASTSQKSYSRGIVSSYAWGEDYHKILSRKLKNLGKHLNQVAGGVGRFYVDTGAILERDFAERAGLGFIGKNSLIINPQAGSGFFIGELFSTVPLPFDGDTDLGTTAQQRGKPGCGKCTKCRDACPTNAIVKDYVVDARKCISYLTIELKGSIPENLRQAMGGRIYGCDICQIVCPWNRIAWDGARRGSGKGGFSPLFGTVVGTLTSPNLHELLMLTDEKFNERFRGSAIRRIGRERMARNAAVALGNVGNEKDIDILHQTACNDESAIVQEHASWAVQQVRKRLARRKEQLQA